MRTTFLLCLLCVSIGTVTPAFWSNISLPSWLTSWFNNPVLALTNEVCTYFSQHPDRAQSAITKIIGTLQAGNVTSQLFSGTLTYINDPANQQKLIGGSSTCPTFFTEIKNAILTDLNNANQYNANQVAATTLTNILTGLKTMTT